MAKQTRIWVGLVVSLLLATPVAAQDPTADTIVATVNGTEITLGHMIALRETLPDQYKALPNDTLFSGILDQLIQQTVLQQSLGDQISKRDLIQLDNERRGYLSGVALNSVISAAVTDEAEDILAQRGVEVVPDIIVNSGGITVSHFEWTQNRGVRL